MAGGNDLKARLDRWADRIVAAQVIARAIIDKRGGDQLRMPNLQGVGPALSKLQDELETDAQKFLDEVEATRARKQVVFTDARKQVADAHKGLTEINSFIADLDKATNGGPTSGDSVKSPEVKSQDSATGGDASPAPLAASSPVSG